MILRLLSTTLSIIIGTAIIIAVGVALRIVYDFVYARFREWQFDEERLRKMRIQARYDRLDPDASGRLGVTVNEHGQFRDHDALTSYTHSDTTELSPELKRAVLIHMLEEVRSHSPAPLQPMQHNLALEDDDVNVTPAQVFPNRVALKSLLKGPPSLSRLALGVTVNENGEQEPVYANLGDLVHIAVAGSSGWGKSVFERVLTYQLCTSLEEIQLAMIDLEGVTLALFEDSNRLLYPIADNEQDAQAIFAALTDEMDRRKELYNQFKGVDSLARYNQMPNVEHLLPIVVIVDEATALLDNSSIESALKTLVLRARKYGLWCCLAGQDWKTSTLSSTIRNQFTSRFQFKANDATQSRVFLGTDGAEALAVPGRALMRVSGRELTTIQTPIIEPTTILAELAGGGPQREMPNVIDVEAEVINDDEELSDEERVLLLRQQGVSLNEIQRRVFGGVGGGYYYRVKSILDTAGDNNS